jgi:FkbM family methyltransferase
MFITYAQNFEDVLLWRALKHVPNGTYVDIGAHEPVFHSVSKAFYVHGWRGLHVEPIQSYVDKLRADRPDEQVLQAAVSDKPGSLTFYEVDGTGLSTAVKEISENCSRLGYQVKSYDVPCMTLDDIVAHLSTPTVHWLKIDVEGYERQALLGWESDVRPWIMVVEATIPMSQVEAHDEWEPLLLEKGYEFVFGDGLNRYYISAEHPELKEKFRYGPNVFDGFVADETCWITHGVQQKAAVEKQTLHNEIGRLTGEVQHLNGLISEKNSQIKAQEMAALSEFQRINSELTKIQDEIKFCANLTADPETTPAPVDPHQKISSAADLLAYSGPLLILKAYEHILGREPDAEGYANQCAMLLQGETPEDFIANILLSAEARQRGTQLPGGTDMIRAYRRQRNPVLGPLLRLFGLLPGRSRADRLARATRFLTAKIDYDLSRLNPGGGATAT